MGWESMSFHAVRAALVAAGIVVAVVLGLKVLVQFAEPWMTFMPPAGDAAKPADLELPHAIFSCRTSDGLALRGWLVPAQPHNGPGGPGGDRRPLTILFFHGNAENISHCLDLALLARPAGYNLALVDYRGFGGNEGMPSETGLYRDGEAALRAVRELEGVDPRRIVLWGRSVGAAVAVYLASGPGPRDAAPESGTDPPPAGVILESPFTSVRDLLREGGHPLFYALSRLGTFRFDSGARMPRVQSPVLVIHGTADEIAPFPQGKRLYDLAPGPKIFAAIPGGGHNDLMALHEAELWGAARRFLQSLD